MLYFITILAKFRKVKGQGMKYIARYVGLLIVLCSPMLGFGQEEVVIQTFDSPGQLTFGPVENAISYRVEWAPSADGPWTNFTGHSTALLNYLEPAGEGTIEVDVPLYYRVIALTIPPLPADGVIVDYLFDQGSGNTVYDVSGVPPAINLTIENPENVSWLDGALRLDSERAILTGSGQKIYNYCLMSQEITISVWVQPSTVSQTGPARIVTFSQDPGAANFMLGFHNDRWITRMRTTDPNLFRTESGMHGLTASPTSTALTHVVYTRFANGEEYMYLNGQRQPASLGSASNSSQTPGIREGTFNNWNQNYDFAIGNELFPLDIERQFVGIYYRVTIYANALSEAEVSDLFNAGHTSQ